MTTEQDTAKSVDYQLQADDMRTQAHDLTFFADQMVSQSLPLHDSSPRRRAGLDLAQALRSAANSYTAAADTYEGWAADLLAHTNDAA